MRRLKKKRITITALLALTVLGATMAASASAALPEFEPGGKAGEIFTGTSGAGTLEEGGQPAIVCSADTDKGEFIGTSRKEILMTIDVSGCQVFGIVGAHSLGDKEGIVLVHVTGILCYLSKTKKEVGIKLAVQSGGVHIEVAGKLLAIIGTVIGLWKPVNTKSKSGEVILKQSKGVQEFTKCEGGSEEILKAAENEGTAVQSGLQVLYHETFEKEVEVLA